MKIKQFALIAILTILSTSLVDAQILNVEKSRLDNDTSKVWVANVSGTFSVLSRQTTITRLGYSVNLAHLAKRIDHVLISNYHILFLDKDAIRKDGSTHYRATFRANKLMSYEAFGQHQFDLVRGMDNRLLGGGGLRFKIKEADKTEWTAGTGAMYEYEKWRYTLDTGDETDTTTQFIKSTSYLKVRHQFNENLSTNMVAYFQTPFSAPHKPRIIADANISVKATKRISFTFKGFMMLDTRPIAEYYRWLFQTSGGLKFSL